jgi:high affinity Mn2+ porin
LRHQAWRRLRDVSVVGGAALLFALSLSGAAFAQAKGREDAPAQAAPQSDASTSSAPAEPDAGASDLWVIQAQATYVDQGTLRFHSPYVGANSLNPGTRGRETFDATLFGGVKPWKGAEIWLDPELDQGFGLSDTLGVAGFPSGEAYKVGSWKPYYRTPRLFLRQTLALGGATAAVESGPNVLPDLATAERLTFTLGKFSIPDVFDNNRYAHDPRADFLNWSIIDSGAFDYAADSWGYTLGGAVEWTTGDWTLRGGSFALSTEPNAETLDTGFAQHAVVLEAERRFELGGRPGAVRLLGYVNRGRIARYDDALAAAAAAGGGVPDVAAVRRNASKSGWALNAEQEFATGVGAFLRLSANDGRHEAYDFTEIDRSLATGFAVQGAAWQRPADTLGVALAVNALAAPARAYFAAGGLGILIGDGQLPRYGRERIVEAYYSARFEPGLSVGVDLQQIANPGYNRDRGPVRVYGLRLHAEF